jgi:hypothetical protein
VSKKPRKVQEGAGAYAAKKQKKAKATASSPKPAEPAIRYATPEQVRDAANEVFKVHAELFRKLAQ